MRKIFIHIVIIFTTLNIVTLNQFSKLPLLAVHYADHLERNSKTTLLDFLAMHYWGHDINDNDEEKDKSLPFKNLSSNAIQHYIQPSLEIQFTEQKLVHTGITLSGAKPVFFPKKSLSALFRPPKATA